MTRWQSCVAWVAHAFRSRYVLLLEEEVKRLRAENRALVNSLLGTAGIPPIEESARQESHPTPRVRRRSWHQLAALREIEEARRGGCSLGASASGGQRLAESGRGEPQAGTKSEGPDSGRGPFH